jgi:hypothetical protein
MKYSLVLSIFLILTSPLRGAVREVPSDYPTIQDGIDAAVDGDTVRVAPGIYSGTGNNYIDFHGKAILVTSSAGPDSTILDGNGFRFIFQNNETYSTILRGFTITGAEYAIYFDSSSPLIVNCHMLENGSYLTSACVLEMHDSSPIVIDCMIGWNWAPDNGTIDAINSDPLLLNTSLFQNYTTYSFQDVFISGGTARFTNCTFFLNQGMYGNVIMKNCIYWDNGWGNRIDGDVNVTYSNIDGGWPGEGNIDADPLFSDQWNDDYHLQSGSPCIDAGDPASRNIRWGGFRRDMGAFEYDQGFYFDGQNLVFKPFPIEIPRLR